MKAFRGNASIDISAVSSTGATYSRDLTVVTVNFSFHGMSVGHIIRFDATSGTATDGTYVVTSVLDSHSFTFTHTASGATSGSCNLVFVTGWRPGVNALKEFTSYDGYNNFIHSAVPNANTANGVVFINLKYPMPDTEYTVACAAVASTDSSVSRCVGVRHPKHLRYFTIVSRSTSDILTAITITDISVFR
jgi:hypothetical protein